MHTTPSIHSSASATHPDFDKLSFLRHIKNIGRPYKKRAVELVSICRTFVQAQNQSHNSYYELRSVLQLVDDALISAIEAGKKTSKEADEAFKNAISRLSEYGRKYHPKENVAERIEVAGETDKTSLKVLNRLTETFRPLKEETPTKVKFLLHKSLPDENPTVVTQALCGSSHLNEILWNFSRFKDKEKRLTLKQNPPFYEPLPKSPENYGDRFRTEPIVTYLHKRISVLTDNLGQAGRVFLNIAKNTRAFGNVWVPKNAIIFKDVCGKLEGEGIVGTVIQDTPNLWCFTEPPPSHTSRPQPSSNRSSPSLTPTATPTTSSTGLLLADWREPIRQMLRSSDLPSSLFSNPPPPAELSPRSPARPSQEPPFNLPSRPTAVLAHSTRVPLPMSLPPQPPSVTPPPTNSATPARITFPLPDTHSRGVSRKDGAFLGDAIPSQAPIAGVPSSGPSVTASPLHVVSLGTPRAESHEAEIAEHVPGQRAGLSYQHKVAARAVTPDPLPQQHVQTVVPSNLAMQVVRA